MMTHHIRLRRVAVQLLEQPQALLRGGEWKLNAILCSFNLRQDISFGTIGNKIRHTFKSRMIKQINQLQLLRKMIANTRQQLRRQQ